MTRAEILNPFIFGKPVPPEHFIGREEIIETCYQRLAGPVRNSIAISGEPGIGKTSLLYYLKDIAQKEQWGRPHTHNIFLYLDCQGVEPFTPTQFWRSVLGVLKDAANDPDLDQQIKEVIKALWQQPEIETLWQQPEINASQFQRQLLRWLHYQGQSLVLLLDGFTSLIKTDQAHRAVTSAFLSSLRALINHPDYALTLLTATQKPLDVLCQDIVKEHGSPFYNNFTFEPLAPFTPSEITSLLKQATVKADFEFDQEDRKLLHHLAGAHPALLQMAGYHLLEERRHGSLNGQIYKEIIDNFERSARHYFDQFWTDASPLEQTLFILIILSHLSGQSNLQLEMSAEEIEQLLQKYEFYLLPLIERGLIQKIEDTYQIFSTIFAWWIVRQLAAQSDIPSNAAHFPVEEEALLRAWQTLRKVAPQLTLDRLTTTLGTRVTKMATPPPLPQRYELQAEVGRGASGIVYKAFDTQLARPVAIKVLHPLSATPPADSRRRLLQEARAASQLQHPHIVTVYDVAETSGQIFLVMEYIGGRSLFDLLQEKQRLPLPEVIVLVEQAAAALDYAHSHEVIHRDIKPANLMLTANGELKLTDFGIAKIVGDPQTTHGTELKGTVIYMSPEQVNQKPLDGRSDLFSLATVTFQMLTGEPPWFGITVIQLMNNISDGDPRSLAAFDIADATLEAVLRKALAKNPADRYQRGADFVQALKQSAITDSSI